MKKFLIALSICTLGFTTIGYSQSSLSILNVVPLLDLDTIALVQPVNMTTQPFELTVSVELSDPTNVQTVYIQIGRTIGSTNVANVSIPYNYTSLPTGVVEVVKNQNYFAVNFGIHTNIYKLYVKVWAADNSGNLTQLYEQLLN